MSRIDKNEFEQFFIELYGYPPFPWQTRLAHQVCDGGWPKVIDLPTASGKTACIDIALFALAVRGKDSPRRIFFVVDRRVIVNEAYVRAKRICEKLEETKSGVLRRVADALRTLDGEEPLKAYELRGGAFRDETWVRSPRQPAVVTSTVDQLGSRILFRGYGIGENTWPMHAGLIANDAILFLDEAHCSKAFSETLEAVEQYRGAVWAPSSVERPFQFVEMTATPGRSVSPQERFGIDEKDRNHTIFQRRLYARKPVRLAEPVKCRKDETGKFADALIAEAQTLQKETNAKRVAILVNRIATAKAVHDRLERAEQRVSLVIGRMRPLDRDKQAQEWQHLKSGSQRSDEDVLEYVVSTQCLEVGADLDFDVLASECASIDALQQRFGRLDRTGVFGRARGAILAGMWQLGAKEGDPVYGDALKQTWRFLQSIAIEGAVNLGIESVSGEAKTVADHLREQEYEKRIGLSLRTESAPKLMPSHLDALAQTSPRPTPEPDVDYFLHGPKRGNPDVYVVWRSDLDERDSSRWSNIVSICPPSSMEAMPVPLWTFKRWFSGESLKDESDVEIASHDEETEDKADHTERAALIWGDKNPRIVRKSGEFRPGDTIVLPVSAKGWNDLGSIPQGRPIDLGDQARLKLRRRITLRLHPEVLEEWWPDEAKPKIREALNRLKEEEDESTLIDTLSEHPPDQAPLQFEDPSVMSWRDFVCGATVVGYPNDSGWALEAFYGRKKRKRESPVFLRSHLNEVVAAVDAIAGDLIPDEIKSALKIAAEYHDYGKVDVRFQSWLRNGDWRAAAFAPKPLAKSGQTVLKKQAECGLPESFRHELLSLKFAEKRVDKTLELRDLVLHLIASHHGYCRPLAPVVIDGEPQCVSFGGVNLCRTERVEKLPHALGSGVADRFWRLTREYGWWGLAYLEGMLRLADWRASDEGKSGGYGMSVVMTALDGSNPLAFMAAVGAFRLMERDEKVVKLRWVRDDGWRPELTGVDEKAAVGKVLLGRAKSELPVDAFRMLGKNVTVNGRTFLEFVKPAYEAAVKGDRTAADFAAAFGSEILEQKGKERIEYTDLCFITGSGHQHFLGTMEGLAQNVSAEHIQDAVFGDWKKDKGLSMRWDPGDAAEYAFRWGDPSAEGASAVWGANLLAVHALRLLPTQPTSDGLETTGFRYSRGVWPEFTWPIWEEEIGLDTLRSLLALPDLQVPEDKLNHELMRERGIAEIYRSPRVRIGQGANFKVSFRQARAV